MTTVPETLDVSARNIDTQTFKITIEDEQRLRDLAYGMARGLEDEDELLKRLGFTRSDYDDLAQTRMFKALLAQAIQEWEGASNTHKRTKLKAATSVEEALPFFFQAMTDNKEPLSSRVKALEVVARIGQLTNPELIPAGGGQFFKLEINLGDNKAPIVIEHGTDDVTAEHDRAANSQSKLLPRQSRVWDDVEQESL